MVEEGCEIFIFAIHLLDLFSLIESSVTVDAETKQDTEPPLPPVHLIVTTVVEYGAPLVPLQKIFYLVGTTSGEV